MRAGEFMLDENFADGSNILYHATYRPLLKSIRSQGLGGSAAQAKWEDSEPGVTYLARDPEVARSYAETSDMVPEEWLDDIVILAIDASRLDPRRLRRDRNVQDDDSTLEYHGVIKDFALTENFADDRPVVDMLEEGCLELSRMLEQRPHLIENYEGWREIQSLLDRIAGEEPVIGQHYAVLNLTITPPGRFLVQQGIRTPVELTNILDRGSYVQYEFDVSGRIFRFPEDHRAGDRLSRTFLYSTPRELAKTQSFIAMSLQDWEIRDRVNENFADGKNPGRKGLSKRVGVSQKMSIAQLKKIASTATGERRRMAQWNLNMKRGRDKS